MARTAEQIEQELDQWQGQRSEILESLESLKAELSKLARNPESLTKAELSAETAKLQEQIQSLKSALETATTTIAELKAANPSSVPPSPQIPSPNPPPDDAAARALRTKKERNEKQRATVTKWI